MAETKTEESTTIEGEAAPEATAMINGEVPFDDPENEAWPDEIPVQSRYGKPEDYVPAQTAQNLEDEDAGLPAPDEPQAGDPVPPRGDSSAANDADEVPDYEDWTKSELVDEINARNEGRDDETRILVSGTKEEIVARLRSDDDAD